MAEISIARKTRWISQLRGIDIYIDDVKVGTLDDGETKVIIQFSP